MLFPPNLLNIMRKKAYHRDHNGPGRILSILISNILNLKMLYGIYFVSLFLYTLLTKNKRHVGVNPRPCTAGFRARKCGGGADTTPPAGGPEGGQTRASASPLKLGWQTYQENPN